jgi:DMSO/TMAO reductase YedYZ molybdopterin-dependent catalytic subunit
MKVKLSIILTIAVVLLAITALSGCTSPSPAVSPTTGPTAAPTAAPKTVALAITGMVDNPLELSMEDLAAYPNVTITTEGKNNTTVTATGVSLNTLLDDAKPKEGAANVTFKAADGYSKTVALSDVRATPDAIVSYESEGALRDIIPGMATSAWVGKAGASLVSIEIS